MFMSPLKNIYFYFSCLTSHSHCCFYRNGSIWAHNYNNNWIKSPSMIMFVHEIMNVPMCTAVGNLGQKHLMFAFLLFPPHTTNKNKRTFGHNARGKLNIELILDRKLSRSLVLQASWSQRPLWGDTRSGRGNPKSGAVERKSQAV